MEFPLSEITLFERFQKNEIERIYQDYWQCQIMNGSLEIDFNEYSLWWIEKNGEMYRISWFSSKCCNCVNWNKCGWESRFSCNDFQGD